MRTKYLKEVDTFSPEKIQSDLLRRVPELDGKSSTLQMLKENLTPEEFARQSEGAGGSGLEQLYTTSPVAKILDSLGLKVYDLSSLDLTDSLIVGRIFEAVQEYAMYHDKNPSLEKQCEHILDLVRQHLKTGDVVE